MKNLFLLTLVSILMFSCETTVVEGVELGPAPGYLVSQDGKIDARDADPSNLAIWEKYIEAHNNKDYETISSINHDSIVLNLWDGRNLFGNEAHLEVLKGYMDEFSPTWNTFFSYTMHVDGQKGDWVITGHQIDQTVDGEEQSISDICDVFIVDEKIRRIIVYRKEN
ncbi:MAG: hypothetical protein ACPGKX_00750 [Flavobacteriaceae bacterium]|jgi:hypothetical protein|tara:strand:- start:15 stop:515 length:501 start_codon:yes stop_codon:yes gene_type:complete